MFSIESHHIAASSTAETTERLQSLLASHDRQFLIGFCEAALLKALPNDLSRTSPCLLASSCLGSANEHQLSLQQHSISVLRFTDKAGFYGVASSQEATDVRAAAAKTLLSAMEKSGRGHLSPQLIWCFQTPGQEEQVLLGIQDIVGTKVPVFGGSSADNSIEGQWGLHDGSQKLAQGFIIAVLYPSVPVLGYFGSGYELTELSGSVTKVTGRKLQEIDGQPAIDVINRWRTQLGHPMLEDGNVLAASTMTPIARLKSSGDIPLLLLSHPAMASGGCLDLFSEVHPGETLHLASGSTMQLIERGPQVIRTARDIAKLRGMLSLEGAIIIFCGGCMLAIQTAMAEVQAAMAAELPNLPFIMGFTFGEQGTFSDGESRHGNLMISCTLFGGDRET
ncbi:FIST N-terminal domain-containing protein [Alkalimonas delamerensis]|uniref:FIST N-terminal domain-containing protein n=1 Tax=Alkalimonas delamerensis TaxID=265981 RepID=A0ABT9GNJ0_9GAMM|nr:FIST N-terminal domain-containing protein [Alkalimonas delamerensis]MDP4528489.1 FIST N-terminal domain-containing protein [Alkalimonas delamerensis]